MGRHIRNLRFEKNLSLSLRRATERQKKPFKELEKILVFLLEKEEATVYNIRKETKIPQATLYMYLDWLLKTGKIVKTREEPFRWKGLTKKFYRLTKEGFEYLLGIAWFIEPHGRPEQFIKWSSEKWLDIAIRNPKLIPLSEKVEEWKLKETPEFFRFLVLNFPHILDLKTYKAQAIDDLVGYVTVASLYLVLKDEIEKIGREPLLNFLNDVLLENVPFYPFSFQIYDVLGLENIDKLKSEFKTFLRNNPKFLDLVEAFLKELKKYFLETIKVLENVEKSWKNEINIQN